MSAKSRWQKLHTSREGVLNRARDAADLTIPPLVPREGDSQDTDYPQPYQSLGARGVNNLASKLSLALLPPNTGFVRFALPDDVLEELGDGRPQVEEGLRKLEQRLMRRVEHGNLRVMIHSALKHLVVAGDALLYLPTKGGARTYALPQYCVVRDPMGTVVEIVIKESVHPSTLSDDVRVATEISMDIDNDKPVDVFTWVKLKDAGKNVEYHQEINDKRVPGSEGRSPAEESPYIALRWTAVPNENYGRGHVEEYIGDLRSLESLSRGIVGFSAIAAKIVFMLHPNSVTDIDALAKAASGDIITGRREDVDVLQLDKYADFQVSKGVIDDITLRLSHAFLLQSGTTRDAERVTAEEIRAHAQELEDALGGVYTVLSQELQLPLARRLMAQMKAAGELPRIPKNGREEVLQPTIITGFDALGRGHELNRMRQYFSDLVGLLGEGAMAMFKQDALAKVMATRHNVDIDELLKSPEEVAEEQQQQQMNALAEKAAGPVAGAMAGSMTQEGE